MTTAYFLARPQDGATLQLFTYCTRRAPGCTAAQQAKNLVKIEWVFFFFLAERYIKSATSAFKGNFRHEETACLNYELLLPEF